MFRRWRRSRLRKQPVPMEWRVTLDRYAPFFAELAPEAQARLLADMQVFLAEKLFLAAGGLTLTPEMPVVVAAAAVRIVQGLDVSYFDRLTEIVLYPGGFYNPLDTEGLDGEAHDWGVVVLAWDAVVEELANPHDGWNIVCHEFAHVLDRADGSFDGTPRLHKAADYRRWAEVMGQAYERLRATAGSGRHVLGEHDVEDEAEFFAVCTEAFFEIPGELAEECPEVFAELVTFYRVDPRGDKGTR
jgi:Mlc titration factor MtfA (ptsG expression regulator)